MSYDSDRRRTHVMFPGRRDGAIPVQPVEPGSIPRLNGLPEPAPYEYRGTEHDLNEPWPDLPKGSSKVVQLPRPGLAMCGPCWDDMCIACQGKPCACACQDWRTP